MLFDLPSAGRLFDGVSAILGIRKKSTFEGEASTALEFAAEAYEKAMQHPYEPLMLKPFTETAEDRLILDTGEFSQSTPPKNVSPEKMPENLHTSSTRNLAEQMISAALTASHQTGNPGKLPEAAEFSRTADHDGWYKKKVWLSKVSSPCTITSFHQMTEDCHSVRQTFAMAYLQKHEIK